MGIVHIVMFEFKPDARPEEVEEVSWIIGDQSIK
jgi:hypothetical protein